MLMSHVSCRAFDSKTSCVVFVTGMNIVCDAYSFCAINGNTLCLVDAYKLDRNILIPSIFSIYKYIYIYAVKE
jgi:hypothetical protein